VCKGNKWADSDLHGVIQRLVLVLIITVNSICIFKFPLVTKKSKQTSSKEQTDEKTSPENEDAYLNDNHLYVNKNAINMWEFN